MISYKKVKQNVDKYNATLQNRVSSTTELTPIQNFSAEMVRKKSSNDKKSNVEIYQDEYARIDKITEEHTQRGVSDIARVFDNLELGDDYRELAKISHELHDIGRRPQYIETATTLDLDSYDREIHKKRGVTLDLPSEIVNHATHGAYLLENGLFDYLRIPLEYREIIKCAVMYHSSNRLPNGIGNRVPEELFQGKSLKDVIEDLAYYTNLVQLYTQAVKSVDNFDLNNKILNGAIPIYREKFGLDVFEGDSISTFSKIWGVSEKTLREYNGIAAKEDINAGDVIVIPTREVPLDKLKVNDDYMRMLMEDSFPDRVGVLQSRKDYSFLAAQVWRLSLLRNIDFKSLLSIVEEDKMLDRMLSLYDEYQPGLSEVMRPAFEYAKEEIVRKGMENSKSKIYTLKRK